MGRRKGSKSSSVTPHEFVKAWQGSESTVEVCDKLGLSRSNVASRASRYRKNGVPLVKFERAGGPVTDWAAVAKIAKDLTPKKGDNR